METLVAVAHHRNQYGSGSRGKANGAGRFNLSPSRGLRNVNCRAFDSGIGLLPSPFLGFGSPMSNRGLLSPKPLSPYGSIGGKYPVSGSSGGKSKSENLKQSKKFVKSSPIAIDLKGGGGHNKDTHVRESLSFSELWAGPAYSNSPPPSSLPMPKFNMFPKRTVSLELPALESDLSLPTMAKSAPASPTRTDIHLSNVFLGDDDSVTKIFSGDVSATETLRRILNLDIVDG